MKGWFIGVVVAAALLGVGTGVGFWQGMEAKSKLADTKAELTDVTAELADTKAELSDVKSQLDKLSSDYESLNQQYTMVKRDYDVLQSDYASLETDYKSLDDKFPPKAFPDADALEEWLVNHPTPPKSADAILWLSHARKVQEAALEDGYVINVEMREHDGAYSVACTAILADGSYYWWDPETDNIYYWLDVRRF